MNKTAYIHVDEHLISPSLICPICLDILEEPHTHLPCDSAFCRSCLLQLAEPLCPICRWTWDDSIPLQCNIYLPKANRLIRNMLDDLLVQCVDCHTVRRRGQFEHQCQPYGNRLPLQNVERISREKLGYLQMILSALVIVFLIIFTYFYRNNLFENAIDRQDEMINGMGINIDQLLLENFYYLSIKIIEYSMIIFILNVCFWFSITFFGDQFLSKTNSRIIKNFFEISIIINLIICSVYN